MGYAGAAGAQPLGRPFNRGFSPRIGAGKLWAAYCTSLVARPMLTKSMTSLAGFCLGDFIAQSATRRQNKALAAEPYDVKRTMRLAFYGGCIAGPIGHYWFNFLDKTVFPKAATSAKAIASKIFLDQLLMAPVGTTLFYIVSSVLQAQPEKIPSTLKEKLVPTLAASYGLWPAAHAINFKFVPSSQRILYTNIVSILWTYILSQAAAAVVQQPMVKGEEEQVISIPQQIAIAITEEEQIAAMAMVVEELTSTSEEPASEQDGATPATA